VSELTFYLDLAYFWYQIGYVLITLATMIVLGPSVIRYIWTGKYYEDQE
jgi:hypothetical protein